MHCYYKSAFIRRLRLVAFTWIVDIYEICGICMNWMISIRHTAHLSILNFFPDSLITVSGSYVSLRFQSRLWIMLVIVVGE